MASFKKLHDKLGQLSRGLDKEHPEHKRRPRFDLAYFLRRTIRQSFGLEKEFNNQVALIETLQGKIQAAYDNLQIAAKDGLLERKDVSIAYGYMSESLHDIECFKREKNNEVQYDNFVHVDNIRDTIIDLHEMLHKNPNLAPIKEHVDSLLQAMDEYSEKCIPVPGLENPANVITMPNHGQ